MAFTGRAKAILDVVSTITVMAAGVLLIWTLIQDQSRSARRSQQGNRTASETVTGLRVEAKNLTNKRGNAAIAIVEFADYQCPFCGTHAREMAPSIQKTLIDSGQAEYVYIHFPLENIHPLALKASEAAECAARQDRYWEMHERLFQDANALAPQALIKHAEDIGLDRPRFEKCLDGEAIDKVRADQAEGRRLGVAGTPTFFLGTVEADGSIALKKRFSGVSSVERIKSEMADLLPERKAVALAAPTMDSN